MRGAPRWVLPLVAGLVVAGTIVTARESTLSRRTADFTIGYSAALLVRAGHPDWVYDQNRLGPQMQRVAQAPIDPRLPFNQPLIAVTPYLGLSLLPLDLAFRVWQAVTILLWLTAFLLLQRFIRISPRAPFLGLAGLLAAAPAWASLGEGQLTGALLLGAVLLVGASRTGDPRLAAAGAALLAIKPQYLPAYLALLWVGRHRRALGFAVGAAGLVGLSPLLAGGSPGLHAMLSNALTADRVVPVRFTESLVGAVGSFLSGPLTAVIAIGLLAASIGSLIFLGRRVPSLALVGLAGWLAVLVSPHSLPHDLVLLAVPAWAAIALAEEGRLPWPAGMLVLVDAGVLLDLHGTPIALAPLAMALALAWAVGAVRQRGASQRQPTVQAA